MKFMFFVLIDMVIIINGVVRQGITKAAPMDSQAEILEQKEQFQMWKEARARAKLDDQRNPSQWNQPYRSYGQSNQADIFYPRHLVSRERSLKRRRPASRERSLNRRRPASRERSPPRHLASRKRRRPASRERSPASQSVKADIFYKPSSSVMTTFEEVQLDHLLIGLVLPTHPGTFLELFPLSFPIHTPSSKCAKKNKQPLTNKSFKTIMDLVEDNSLSYDDAEHFTRNLETEVQALTILSTSKNFQFTDAKIHTTHTHGVRLSKIFKKAVKSRRFMKNDFMRFSKIPTYFREKKEKKNRTFFFFKIIGFFTKLDKFWKEYRNLIQDRFKDMANEIVDDELWSHEIKLHKLRVNNVSSVFKDTIEILRCSNTFSHVEVEAAEKSLDAFTSIISNIRIYGRYTVDIKETDQEKMDEIDRVAKLELMFMVPQEMLSNLVGYYDYINSEYFKMMEWATANFVEGHLINGISSLSPEDVNEFCSNKNDPELCLVVKDTLDSSKKIKWTQLKGILKNVKNLWNAYWEPFIKDKLKLKDNAIAWVFNNWQNPETMWEYQLKHRDLFFAMRQSLTSDLDTLKEEVTNIAKMTDDVMMSSEEKKLWEDKHRFCQHRLEQYLKMNQHLSYSTLFVSNLDYFINRKPLTFFPFHERGCTAAEMGYSVFPPEDGASKFELPRSANMGK
eukprot:GHVL01035872.1.p1 GENE.GHVL01035872.1~~GHVL01035872.1.p1  ORF type:complete len:692 (+),score=96.34 GHVL01035872.1:44-2077(+)